MGGVWLTTQSKVLTIEDQFQFGNQNKKKKRGPFIIKRLRYLEGFIL